MDAPSDFAWDPGKAERNARQHGITFHEAQAVFLDPEHVVVSTVRERDEEDRRKIIGHIAGRLFAVVFVMRGGTCRLISARRTNTKEDRTYGDR